MLAIVGNCWEALGLLWNCWYRWEVRWTVLGTDGSCYRLGLLGTVGKCWDLLASIEGLGNSREVLRTVVNCWEQF